MPPMPGMPVMRGVPVQTVDAVELVSSIGQVLAVGLLLGAGIPLLFAVAVRSLLSKRRGSTVLGGVLVGVCVLLALVGIVVIVFGDRIFGG